MTRTGALFRGLPEGFGRWNLVFKRFQRWVNKGVFEQLFELMAGQDAERGTALAFSFVKALDTILQKPPPPFADGIS